MMSAPNIGQCFLKGIDKLTTDNGKPAALMMSISEDSFEDVLAMVRQMKAKRAFEEIQAQAQAMFPSGLTEAEIQAEIDAARKGE